MRRTGFFVGLTLCVGALVASSATIDGTTDDRRHFFSTRPVVVLLDDCDRRDPDWAAIGGCTLPRGKVTTEEFDEYLVSPLVPSIVGHPSWANDPGYVKLRAWKRLRIRNEGGRTHTFTEVASFGGGRVPPLNGVGIPGLTPLTPAPECLSTAVINIPGGAKDETEELGPGNHNFQCCIHPWMRTVVRVGPHHDDDHDDDHDHHKDHHDHDRD
jgi:hypothetical protein